jgi:hypothetical protein
VQWIHRGLSNRKLWGIRAADHNRTGAAQVLHDRGVGGRQEIRQGGNAVGRRLARLVDIYFDCDRRTEQRSRVLGVGQLSIILFSFTQLAGLGRLQLR